MAQFFTTKELERYIKENYIDHLLTYMGETEDRYGKGFIYYHEESTNDYEGTFSYSDVKGYHYVYMDKNSVRAHQLTQDLFDISYWVLDDYVYHYASDYSVDIYKNLVLDGVNAYQGMYDEMTADMDHDLQDYFLSYVE